MVGLSKHQYKAAIEARRALTVAGTPGASNKNMKSLIETGWDGDYVVPNQISSRSLSGPVLLLDNWIGWLTAEDWPPQKNQEIRSFGYDRSLTTNRRLDAAIRLAKTSWNELYITQACVLLPRCDSDAIPHAVYRETFSAITKLEIAGRKVIAAGSKGRDLCKADGTIEYRHCRHPSRESVETLRECIEWAMK